MHVHWAKVRRITRSSHYFLIAMAPDLPNGSGDRWILENNEVQVNHAKPADYHSLGIPMTHGKGSSILFAFVREGDDRSSPV